LAEMTGESRTQPKRWSSRFAFLMASIGAAVGLGNLWRFPFQAGENGGSAFVLVYFLCVALLAYPVMLGELAIGRHQRGSAVASTSGLANASGRSPLWGSVGFIGALATYSVLMIYGVIGGRVLAYAVISFAEIVIQDATLIYQGPMLAFFWQSLFMALTVAIVIRGLREGIERFSTLAMPVFFILLIGVCAYALITGSAQRTITYLFSPRFSELRPDIILAALGQAFFSLAVGGAAMLSYGAFLKKDTNIPADGALIAGADTLVAVVAGLMIFPIVFSFQMDPAAGMGLIFTAMPAAFAQMPGGAFIGGMFFFLAFIAALTSSIAMLVIAAIIGEERLKISQSKSALMLGLFAWAVGAASIFMPHLSEMIDFTAGQIMMPIGGLSVAIFAGWIAPKTVMRSELSHLGDLQFAIWHHIVRYAAPVAVTLILIFGLMEYFG